MLKIENKADIFHYRTLLFVLSLSVIALTLLGCSGWPSPVKWFTDVLEDITAVFTRNNYLKY